MHRFRQTDSICIYLWPIVSSRQRMEKLADRTMLSSLWMIWQRRWRWWNKAVFNSMNEKILQLWYLRLNWMRLPYANEKCKSLAHAINCWFTVAQVSGSERGGTQGTLHKQWNNVFIFTTQIQLIFFKPFGVCVWMCVLALFVCNHYNLKAMGYMLIAF